MLLNSDFSALTSINCNSTIPTGNYMSKVNNSNSRTRCEICLKLTVKTPERRHWRRSGVFIVNSKHISYLGLVLCQLGCQAYKCSSKTGIYADRIYSKNTDGSLSGCRRVKMNIDESLDKCRRM